MVPLRAYFPLALAALIHAQSAADEPVYRYDACFTYSSTQPPLIANPTVEDLTLAQCASACADNSLFGVFDTLCYCGNVTSTVMLPDTSCYNKASYACAGDTSELCGAPGAMALFAKVSKYGPCQGESRLARSLCTTVTGTASAAPTDELVKEDAAVAVETTAGFKFPVLKVAAVNITTTTSTSTTTASPSQFTNSLVIAPVSISSASSTTTVDLTVTVAPTSSAASTSSDSSTSISTTAVTTPLTLSMSISSASLTSTAVPDTSTSSSSSSDISSIQTSLLLTSLNISTTTLPPFTSTSLTNPFSTTTPLNVSIGAGASRTGTQTSPAMLTSLPTGLGPVETSANATTTSAGVTLGGAGRIGAVGLTTSVVVGSTCVVRTALVDALGYTVSVFPVSSAVVGRRG